MNICAKGQAGSAGVQQGYLLPRGEHPELELPLIQECASLKPVVGSQNIVLLEMSSMTHLPPLSSSLWPDFWMKLCSRRPEWLLLSEWGY